MSAHPHHSAFIHAPHIDAHCHLDAPALAVDLPDVVERCLEAGIGGAVLAGVSPEAAEGQRAQVRRLKAMGMRGRWTVGLHPVQAAQRSITALEETLAAVSAAWAHPEPPAAIGELGLDSLFAPRDTLDHQVAFFRGLLACARTLDQPVVLHIVGPGCHGRALEVLQADGLPAAGGVVHGFTGSLEVAQRHLGLGLHIGLGPRVTWPAASKIRRAVSELPLERLLLETDAPDQRPHGAPAARRGEPTDLLSVAAEVARLKGVSVSEVLAASDQAASRLYGF